MSTVYQYDTCINHIVIAVLSLIIAILIGVWIRAILVPIIRGDRDDHGQRIHYKDIPLSPKLILQLAPTIIILVVCIGLGNLIRGYAGFEIKMENGDSITWTGDPELVSYEEDWSRDSFLGYNATLSMDGQIFSPADSFSMEVIDLFQSDAVVTLCYGYMNDELFVWTITTQEYNSQ